MFKKTILVFEKENVSIILTDLKTLDFNDLVEVLTYNNKLILSSESLIVKEGFDFEVHLEVLFNYIKEVILLKDEVDLTKAKSIISSDFKCYWQNIISPKLRLL